MSRHKRPTRGIHPVHAAVAAFGFSLPIWSVATDQRWVMFLGLFIGYTGLYFVEKARWNQASLKGTTTAILIILAGFAAVSYGFDAIASEDFNTSPTGAAIQHALLFIWFFLCFIFVYPVSAPSPKEEHHEQPTSARTY